MNRQFEARNSLMFTTSEDLYFITYNVLIILYSLECKGNKKFKDAVKLAFLIEFVANKELIWALDKNASIQNETDEAMLSRAYSDGLMRISSLKRVLTTLKQKGLIHYSIDNKQIWLTETERLNTLFNPEYFEYEVENVRLITKRVQRLNTISVQKFLDNTFSNHGIEAWANL